MRVDTESLDAFLELLARYRPCPRCHSARVTVQRVGSGANDPLRTCCADCGTSHVVRPNPQ